MRANARLSLKGRELTVPFAKSGHRHRGSFAAQAVAQAVALLR